MRALVPTTAITPLGLDQRVLRAIAAACSCRGRTTGVGHTQGCGPTVVTSLPTAPPTDLMYVPGMWHHGVENVMDSIALAVEMGSPLSWHEVFPLNRMDTGPSGTPLMWDPDV